MSNYDNLIPSNTKYFGLSLKETHKILKWLLSVILGFLTIGQIILYRRKRNIIISIISFIVLFIVGILVESHAHVENLEYINVFLITMSLLYFSEIVFILKIVLNLETFNDFFSTKPKGIWFISIFLFTGIIMILFCLTHRKKAMIVKEEVKKNKDLEENN